MFIRTGEKKEVILFSFVRYAQRKLKDDFFLIVDKLKLSTVPNKKQRKIGLIHDFIHIIHLKLCQSGHFYGKPFEQMFCAECLMSVIFTSFQTILKSKTFTK